MGCATLGKGPGCTGHVQEGRPRSAHPETRSARPGRDRSPLRGNGPRPVQRGTIFLEEASAETTGDVAMEAGRTYDIESLLAFKEAASLSVSALAVGLGPPSGEAEISEAVEPARGAEAGVVFVGRGASWKTEEANLPGLAVPGWEAGLIEPVAAGYRPPWSW